MKANQAPHSVRRMSELLGGLAAVHQPVRGLTGHSGTGLWTSTAGRGAPMARPASTPSWQPTVSVWAANGWPVSCVPAFRSRCRQAGAEGSMGRRGDAYDNAVAESFFALDFDVMRSWSTRHP